VITLTPALSEPSLDTAALTPRAQVLRDDLHALETAQAFAAYAAEEAAVRDRERRLPWAELERFTALGLGSISIPKAYGGPGVSHSTLAQVFKTISAADPALGQIPQNHFGILRVVELVGTTAQKHWLFKSVLEGHRIGNAGPERNTRHTLELKARAKRVGGDYLISGQKFYSTGALFAHWVTVKALDDQGARRSRRTGDGLHTPGCAGVEYPRRLVRFRSAHHSQWHGAAQ
jgi:alkylation response protein AidB-like acyl-CoA dehydrogenase